jgi:hypothetical protein
MKLEIEKASFPSGRRNFFGKQTSLDTACPGVQGQVVERTSANMSPQDRNLKPVVDGLTLVAIAAMAISFTVAFHEGVHALACLATGGDLLEYSALYEECDSPTVMQAKIVAGSAPTFNLLAGTLLWLTLRRWKNRSSQTWLFLWLLMLMNWFYGAGYFMFSGLSNIGDWAVVIEGWAPNWLWRALMIIIGAFLYILFIRQGLKLLSTRIGGRVDEQLSRANKLFITPYVTAIVVILVAGLFCPCGWPSLPTTAGLIAAGGALSPFVFMIRWFRTEHFEKPVGAPLEIRRHGSWIAAGVVVVFVYVYILGQTIYF